MADLIVGADIGGSSTRVLVATLDGEVLGHSRSGAGNPNAVGLEESARRIRETTQSCLAGVPGTVQALVVGLAGASRVTAERGFLAAITPERVAVAPVLVSDLSIAFAAATPELDGYVVVAGTGAVAGRIADLDLVERRDGWGWLLGDEGAGFWLGREAVRSTLGALESGRPLTSLHRAVLAATGARDARGLLQHCYAEPPIRLARLGSLVATHADDISAQLIGARAVERLEALLADLGPVPGRPIVLAGSVLSPGGPVGAELRSRLVARWPNEVLGATSGLVGALWIAARSCGVTSAEVHAKMISTQPDAA